MHRSNTTAKIICFLLAAGLLAYTGIRSYALSFTHDESLSYLLYNHRTFMDIVSNNTGAISANNHIINTLLMKLFGWTLGPSELALRLQSVLAHAAYLILTWNFVKRFGPGLPVIAAFVILNVNPYLLDFFSLARGYALGISLMLGSIYLFVTYLQDGRPRLLLFSLITGALAAIANFAMLNYFVSLVLLYQLYLWFNYSKNKKGPLVSRQAVIVSAILAGICYEPIRWLIVADQLFFGGAVGLWEDTVNSSIATFFYGKSYHVTYFVVVQAVVIATVAGYACVLVYRYFKKKLRHEDRTGGTVLFILLCILFASFVQHHLLGSFYLQERFALFIVPLFMLVFVFALDHISKLKSRLRYSGHVLFTLAALGLLAHFSQCFNIAYSHTWKYDACNEAMLTDLSKQPRAEDKKTRLGITWLFEPSINFYRETKKLDWLEMVTRDGMNGEYDYYYVTRTDLDTLLKRGKVPLKEYPVENTVLLK